MKTLIREIQDEYNVFKETNNRKPTYLILNPMSMGALIEEVSTESEMDFYLEEELIRYLGLKIAITHDPDFNEFDIV